MSDAPKAAAQESRGHVIVSIFGLAIFLIALIIGAIIFWLKNDASVLTLAAGAALTNGGTVFQYWLGSSKSDDTKTAMLGK